MLKQSDNNIKKTSLEFSTFHLKFSKMLYLAPYILIIVLTWADLYTISKGGFQNYL